MSTREVVDALGRGGVVIVPTDTVYGLACAAERPDAVRRLTELKSRGAEKPIAVLAARVDDLFVLVPELQGRDEAALRALLPAALTIVLPNPARRLPWLTGERPETIGVRVPAVTGAVAELLEEAGPLAATSANLTGGVDPRTIADVPGALRAAVDAVLDGGALAGTPSTVVDLTGARPTVLREGAVAADDVLARMEALPRPG